MKNETKIAIYALLLISGLCVLSSCTLRSEIRASGLSRKEVKALPYWKVADSITGAENRFTDTWCAIASGEDL